MGNRAAEEACLNKAIELALKQRGWTKKLAKSSSRTKRASLWITLSAMVC